MSQTESDRSPARPWLLLGTLGWTALSLVVWLLLQTVVVTVLLYRENVDIFGGDRAAIERVGSGSLALSLSLIMSLPAQLGVIWLATRIKRWRFADYLALSFPSRRYLWLGIAILVVLLPLGDLTSYFAGRDIVPRFMIEAYRSARDTGLLPLLALAIIVAAPVGEELVFRGFMFRGLEASRVGPIGAIVIPAVIWAAMHVQYELFHIVQIVVIGCVFGWLRWRSGSTLLTVILHMLINATAFMQASYWAERVAA